MVNMLRERIKGQKYFYRDNYRRGCNLLVVMLLVICGLVLANVFVYMSRSLPDFYASSSNGTLASLTPMDTPNYSHAPLIQ